MRVRDILRTKSDHVVTIAPEATVQRLLAVLAEHRIGAAVVSRTGASVEGIVSERDVVRAIAARGASVLTSPVSAICTVEVFTATPDTGLDDLMRIMHEHRVRHVPVLTDGALGGIVSIGDVVRTRIEELEDEHAALTDYITGVR